MFMILLCDNDYRQIILKRRNMAKSIITDSEEKGLLHYQDQYSSFSKISRYKADTKEYKKSWEDSK